MFVPKRFFCRKTAKNRVLPILRIFAIYMLENKSINGQPATIPGKPGYSSVGTYKTCGYYPKCQECDDNKDKCGEVENARSIVQWDNRGRLLFVPLCVNGGVPCKQGCE